MEKIEENSIGLGLDEKKVTLSPSRLVYEKVLNFKPIDKIAGYDVRPGFYEINGATAIPGGVNFTIHSHQATSCELLFFKYDQTEPFAVLKFPEKYKIGHVYSMVVFNIDISEFEYAYRMDGPSDPSKGIIFDKNRILLDPYAKAVTGQSTWGTKSSGTYRARVVKNDFDWEGSMRPLHDMEDLVIYEMHVRGFTKDTSSEVLPENQGTFAGVMEKIPYLKDLGVTAVELMPIFEFDEMLSRRDFYGRELMDYWGYNTVCFFAPNTSYSSVIERNREGSELQSLIKELHDNGIEVFLDVVFNHTAEGNENGPFFCFKGIDNNIYYMLTPEGYYYNFSGCGNTLNCNHPIVHQLILDCLRYWVTAYHIDGFRFDLASILGRNEDGSPMSQPPLLQSLAFDPIMGDIKLIAEAWDAGGMYQVGSFPSWNRWAEWNGRYRDELRSFLKGDFGRADAAAKRIMGSPDLYARDGRGHNASVNFINCHDGFTLHDLYTYNEKHNDDNNWDNTDGANDNYSWNCGFEGETSDKEINKLRKRMVRNAAAVLFMSRGTPMFFMGDEFGNSQGGNNNAYCQDNYIAWLNWRDLELNMDLHRFFRDMISLRRSHPAIRKSLSPSSLGFPEMSIHDTAPWCQGYNGDSHYIGVMFAGRLENGEEDIVYVAVNSWWESLSVTLPEFPANSNMRWGLAVDTYDEDEPFKRNPIPILRDVRVEPRTVKVFVAGVFESI
ncbi:MAG: glycogen debranching enzyme [Lachnospiraceae bacterium]|nr:glycogen debranching enzyme [Lachnospiraceae bacterium]